MSHVQLWVCWVRCFVFVFYFYPLFYRIDVAKIASTAFGIWNWNSSWGPRPLPPLAPPFKHSPTLEFSTHFQKYTMLGINGTRESGQDVREENGKCHNCPITLPLLCLFSCHPPPPLLMPKVFFQITQPGNHPSFQTAQQKLTTFFLSPPCNPLPQSRRLVPWQTSSKVHWDPVGWTKCLWIKLVMLPSQTTVPQF
jgi:hypothetical protein